MPDLLLELFSEEIPARMQAAALAHLEEGLGKELNNAGIPGQIKGYVTPRRLAVIVRDLPATQADVNTELKGPKIDAPEQALQGFLKKAGTTVDKLEKRDGVYVFKLHQKGKPTAEVVKAIVEGIMKSFPWPKSMRWGSNDVTWVRPLHSILCIFDGKVVPVEFAGVKAGNSTRGHRFLAPEIITIKSPDEYEAALKKAHVIADRNTRRDEIRKQAEALAAKSGFSLKADEGLLEEVTGLVEWPVALMGGIDAKFMDLPPEVLTTVMKKHQKYFALTDKGGNLAPHFITIANMETKDGGKAVIAGNERVLRARFSDARFFWDQDRKKPLSDWAKDLKTVTFHAKLGSIADKVERIAALADKLAGSVDGADKKLVQRAANLCKADLVTGMVGEFAELQGIMGRYYAQGQKEDFIVADAIRDHYKPQGPSDSVPHTPVAICVALADKLDTLVSMFAIGEKPTGSKDPFALRRAALGIIRTILENNVRLPLKSFFGDVPAKNIALHMSQEKLAKKTEAKLHEPHKVGKYLTVNEAASTDIEEAVPANLANMLYEFFADRLVVQLKDSGIRHDIIKAVVASGDDDFVRVVARAKAVQEFSNTDDGKNLLAGYKRAANIVAIEEKKDKITYAANDLKAAVLKEMEEKELAGMLDKSQGEIKKLLEAENFNGAMKALSVLRASVDRFFDKTMVNCEDKDLRANRLRLLSRIRGSMDSVANFALIEG